MKKKILIILTLLIVCFSLSGCFNNNDIESANITTTVYPIEYLVSRLYDSNSKISSIYPNGIDTTTYELTTKQINNYAQNTDIFVYNGLSNEKELARTLINKNKKIQIVDVSYGLKYTNGVEELWLSPSNYLMLANTIRTDLEELSSSKYAAEKIEKNYKNLEEDLSILDAQIKNIADTAKANGKETIVVGDNSFKFLDAYGFNTISVAYENDITTTIKNKFKNKEYQTIFVKDKKNLPDPIKDLIDNYGATIVEINPMTTLSDEERKNNDTYLTIMNDFISNLSNTVLK